MAKKELNTRQKKFADEYIISGNAYESAIKAGYSENYAKAQSHKLLDNVGNSEYYQEKIKIIQEKKVASQEEVLQYLTAVMRGEEKETEMIQVGDFQQELVEVPPAQRDRIRAAELLGKRYVLWTDKIDQTTRNIEIDVGDWDGD